MRVVLQASQEAGTDMAWGEFVIVEPDLAGFGADLTTYPAYMPAERYVYDKISALKLWDRPEVDEAYETGTVAKTIAKIITDELGWPAEIAGYVFL